MCCLCLEEFCLFCLDLRYDTQEAEWLELRLYGRMNRREWRLVYESFMLRRYKDRL